MFLTEGFLLGLCGTGLGAVVGLLVSAGLNAAQVPVPLGVQLFLMTDRLVLTPTVGWVIFAVVFITFCITAISLIPSFLAARMKPVTAMHHIG
jgi:putative ABC transport system permease protein